MIDEHTMTPAIRRWLDESFATLPDPASISARVRAGVHETPQHRGWLPHPEPGVFRAMFDATKIILSAVVVVVLFGGLLMTGVLTTRPNKDSLPAVATSPSASAPPTAPTVRPAPSPSPTRSDAAVDAEMSLLAAPRPIRSGTLDTPLGRARWVYLRGERDLIPAHLEPVPVPGGHVVYARTRIGHGLWFSHDLLEWRTRPLPPGRPGGFTALGGYLWALTLPLSEPGWAGVAPSLWRSTDGSDWETVDASELIPSGPDDIEWSMYFGEVVSRGEMEVMPLTFEARWAASHLGLGDAWGIEPNADGSYEVKGGYGADLGTVRFEPIPGGLRVVDATGEELTTLDGWDMGFIDRWASGPTTVPIEHRIAVVRDGTLTAFDLPGIGPGDSSGIPGIVTTDQGFTIYQPREDGTTATWDSRDGMSWNVGETLGDDPAEPKFVREVEATPSGPVLTTVEPSGDLSDRQRWRLSDDGTWQASTPGANGSKLAWQAQLGPGTLLVREGTEIEFLGDGDDPSEPMETEGLRLTPGNKLWGGAISGRAVVISTLRGGQHHHWIIRFDDLAD